MVTRETAIYLRNHGAGILQNRKFITIETVPKCESGKVCGPKGGYTANLVECYLTLDANPI